MAISIQIDEFIITPITVSGKEFQSLFAYFLMLIQNAVTFVSEP
ncbi:hypothetical protein MADA3029_1180037 [Vibrio nigripulchritudo MADA3029]|nr:hypothetical protein MADA3029_1180037 [Vibrio nigripulchritudo MADA3029]